MEKKEKNTVATTASDLPLVSLLIANFNNGRFIAETLASAVAQNYKNIEIVVIDDASTDDSVAVVSAFAAKNPVSNIRFFQNTENSGSCGRIKRQCVEAAAGEYFAFLDPEDTITPDAVERLMQVHLQNPQKYSIVYSTHYLCNEQLEPQEITDWAGKIPDGQSHLTSEEGHISAFALCSRMIYDRTEGINPACIVAEDMDLYLKMEEHAPVFFLPEPLYYYRKHDHNASWDYKKRYRNLFWRHTVELAAYRRRRESSAIAQNLTRRQWRERNFVFYMQMAKCSRQQKQYWKSICYNIKALVNFF